MESFEYYRVTSSPQPGSPIPQLHSPTWSRGGSPGASLARSFLDQPPAAASSRTLGHSSSLADSVTRGEYADSLLDECGSPAGSYEYAAGEQFAREATAAIKYSGWLLKAFGKGPNRQWRKHWVSVGDLREGSGLKDCRGRG
jgi:hypothetical protein